MVFENLSCQLSNFEEFQDFHACEMNAFFDMFIFNLMLDLLRAPLIFFIGFDFPFSKCFFFLWRYWRQVACINFAAACRRIWSAPAKYFLFWKFPGKLCLADNNGSDCHKNQKVGHNLTIQIGLSIIRNEILSVVRKLRLFLNCLIHKNKNFLLCFSTEARIRFSSGGMTKVSDKTPTIRAVWNIPKRDNSEIITLKNPNEILAFSL